jgi:hypothetical protein
MASLRYNKYNLYQSLQLIMSKRYVKINITEKDPHLQLADIIKWRINKCHIKQYKIILDKIEPVPGLQ